ncbi:isoprenylcysteine carboxylmethyltransferase family protein [uncultured Vibrio sp.]|uniref:methyltransferase family protein n=1 Tax=uncultured Vibrio sp. TaxID=114054 RepID=UPI0025EEAFD7|nr:isoprenylcysteine carboxylmethyltransferase family protein [uncultured Vibrio sp.]
MKKILPPFLFIMFIIAMALLFWVTESRHPLAFPNNLFGLPLIGLGFLLALSGKQLFKKRKANVMTFDDPTLLITDGVFNYTRNPMYLGFVIAMTGFSLLMGASLSSFLLTTVFFIITDRWYISFEEEMMRVKFGKNYEEYCKRVRRWI